MIDVMANFGEGREQSLVQALIAKATIKALHKAVLLRFARRDVMPTNFRFLAPFKNSHAGEVRTAIRDNRLRLAATPSDDHVKLSSYAPA